MEVTSDTAGRLLLRESNGQLLWYPPGVGAEARPVDSDSERERLRAAQGRAQMVFALPGVDVRLLTLEITPEEKKHINSSLAFTLEEQLAEDIDDLHFASRPVGKLGLSVAVCRRQRMEEWQTLLEGLGTVHRWLPEPLLLPWQPGEWCLVLEGGMGTLRHGECSGLAIERELLPAVLAQLADEEATPETVVVYGQDQEGDTALLPEVLRDRVQWRRGDMGTALLLAPAGAETVNLLQGEYAPRLPLKRWWQQWQRVAAVFAAAFVLQLAATWADYYHLEQQNLALRGAIQDSYRQANPRGQAPEPEKQLQRQLAGLRGGGQASGFVALMDRVGEVLASKPGTTIASINYNDRGGEMRMNIVAADFETVEAIRLALNEAGLQAQMENSNTQGDRVRARIRVGERS